MLKHLSSRFDLESLDHEERNAICIPELGMTWGAAWSAIRNSWKRFYIAKANGNAEEVEMLLERITYIRNAMGLEDQGTYF